MNTEQKLGAFLDNAERERKAKNAVGVMVALFVGLPIISLIAVAIISVASA